MQLDQFQTLLRMLVERILEEIWPDETGVARVQQVGLFTLIFMLQNTGEPVTASRLAALTQQTQSLRSQQIVHHVDARGIAAGSVEALDEAAADWIVGGVEYDRYGRGRSFCGKRGEICCQTRCP